MNFSENYLEQTDSDLSLHVDRETYLEDTVADMPEGLVRQISCITKETCLPIYDIVRSYLLNIQNE